MNTKLAISPGFGGGHHNATDDCRYIMNVDAPLDWRLGLRGARVFNALNMSFLSWLLPKPQ